MTKLTTMENLECEMNHNAATLKFGDHVIYTYCHYKDGYKVEIYEFIDEPGKDFDAIECRISLIDTNGGFEDGGHAVEWAINLIKEVAENV